MKIAAFLGSPRKEGNTELLLNAAIKGVKDNDGDVSLVNLNELKIQPCQDCGDCCDTGICTKLDDMTKIYDEIRYSDRFVLASPIFFSSVSAQAKAMIDRCQSFWCEKYLLNRPIEPNKYSRKGLLLLVGGRKNQDGVDCAALCTKSFFRTISVPEHEVLSYTQIDAKGDILKHPTALDDAYQAGKNLAI